MRKIITVCLLFMLGGLASQLEARLELQDTIKQTKDKSLLLDERIKSLDSTMVLNGEISSPKVVIVDSLIQLPIEFKPNPNKAIIYALIPGGGQIYNRKYWKLPIVYGGFVGLAYAITWNGRMYNDYADAYKDLMTGEGDSWKNVIKNPNITEAQKERYKPQLKRKKDYFRRNRDLAMIGAVALYALTLLDTYVDAQLYDFDVSPDLSMRVNPIIFDSTPYSNRAFGVQCSVAF